VWLYSDMFSRFDPIPLLLLATLMPMTLEGSGLGLLAVAGLVWAIGTQIPSPDSTPLFRRAWPALTALFLGLALGRLAGSLGFWGGALGSGAFLLTWLAPRLPARVTRLILTVAMSTWVAGLLITFTLRPAWSLLIPGWQLPDQWLGLAVGAGLFLTGQRLTYPHPSGHTLWILATASLGVSMVWESTTLISVFFLTGLCWTAWCWSAIGFHRQVPKPRLPITLAGLAFFSALFADEALIRVAFNGLLPFCTGAALLLASSRSPLALRAVWTGMGLLGLSVGLLYVRPFPDAIHSVIMAVLVVCLFWRIVWTSSSTGHPA